MYDELKVTVNGEWIIWYDDGRELDGLKQDGLEMCIGNDLDIKDIKFFGKIHQKWERIDYATL